MRGMLLANAGAELTQFGAQRTDTNRKRRRAPHPLRSEQTDIGAITAEPDTAGRQILVGLVRHADHVIPAGIADTRTG